MTGFDRKYQMYVADRFCLVCFAVSKQITSGYSGQTIISVENKVTSFANAVLAKVDAINPFGNYKLNIAA